MLNLGSPRIFFVNLWTMAPDLMVIVRLFFIHFFVCTEHKIVIGKKVEWVVYFFKFHKRILRRRMREWRNSYILHRNFGLKNGFAVYFSRKCKKVQHPFLKSIFQYRFISIFFSTLYIMQKNIFETKQKMMMAQKADKTKLFQSFLN